MSSVALWTPGESVPSANVARLFASIAGSGRAAAVDLQRTRTHGVEAGRELERDVDVGRPVTLDRERHRVRELRLLGRRHVLQVHVVEVEQVPRQLFGREQAFVEVGEVEDRGAAGSRPCPDR